MPTPTRILRSLAEELDPTMFDRTLRQECQFQRIMKVAPTLLTFWSGDRITFSALAIAMRMAPSTLRYHFVDIPALLGYLIREHLRAITTATAQIPHDAPDLLRRRRAAYLEFTRKPLGAHTLMHLLMLNNLPILPDDVRLPLVDHLNQIAANLAPPGQAEIVLALLDNPYLTARRVEGMMATGEELQPEPAEPAPLPEPPELASIGGDELPGGNIWIRTSPRGPFEHLSDEQLRALRTRPAPPPELSAHHQAPPG
jgi:AcrR family transcriptional regulator